MNSRLSSPLFKIAVGSVALLIVAAVYLLTFQIDICSNPNEYVIDSGEYQIALALWGTVHYTGSPTYSMVGAVFVWLLRLIGVPPAAGAALFSVASALAALGLVYVLGLHLTGNAWASSAAVLALALGRSFWINSVVAEIYAFGLALSVASLWLAVRYDETRSARTLYALAFVWGLAVVHHRLAVFMAPALVVLVTPGFWNAHLRLRLLAGSFGMGLLAFASYLYMPLRARMGAWTYGDPGSWQGFWFIFWAREVPFLLTPPSTIAELAQNVLATFATLAAEWTAPGLLAAALGLAVAVAWRRTRRLGWALTAMAIAFLVFVFVFHVAVSPEEVLLWVSVCLALALAILAARLWQAWPWAGRAGAVALLALAGLSGVTHRDTVLALTRDSRGRQLINLLEAEMPAGRPGNEPTLMALWGGDYFAAAYGRLVTGELQHFRVVDHRADFLQLVDSGVRLITLPSTFNELPKSWWRTRIGGAYLSSAGLGLVEIGARPPLAPSDVPPGQAVELGDGIRLLGHHVQPQGDGLRVTLYWQATQTPSQNYSVLVHLSDKDQIAGPGDIMAQADSQNPVYGWYPTTRWSPGEIVREDYGLAVPPGKTPRLVAVGMYTRDNAGAFHNLGIVSLPVSD
jgi:Protein O-mannosyl-transferase TMEM260-like